MKSAKTKKATKHSVQKVSESGKSGEFRSETDDLRLGMERRKFSYTIHIPERRSGQIHIEDKQSFPKRDTGKT